MTQVTSALDTSIQFVKGVGPKLAAIFGVRGIVSIRDLLFFFPRRYEDRTQLQKISEVADGVKATLNLRVVSQKKSYVARLRKTILDVRCEDESGSIQLKWFHPPWGIDKKLVAGCSLLATGKIKFFQNRPEMVHPEVSFGGIAEEPSPDLLSEDLNFGRIVPVYADLEGISGKVLRKVLSQALDQFGSKLEEEIPHYLLKKRQLPSVSQALHSLHFPTESLDSVELQNSRARFAYEEFLKFQHIVLRRKFDLEKQKGYPLGKMGQSSLEGLKAKLPFSLTVGQENVLQEICSDLSQNYPMNRLLQGEVGSGKTVIAFLSAAGVISQGGQVALMAPTEILAVQHVKTMHKLFQDLIPVELLTGRTAAAERKRIFSRLSAGEPLLLIGTHALIEDPVSFSGLNLVIIDEQHRFGVEQRRALTRKGERSVSVSAKKSYPHVLLLSATPIPRTLALSVFGDLALSTLTELPPGRSPVQTRVVRTASDRKKVYESIQAELRLGRQAYFIYPLVNESEAEGFTHLKSATDESTRLAREVFPNVSVGLLHGQQTSDEKNTVMDLFKSGHHSILVSTTVVEVGVDVPNATVMVIEHAERFGLSQLHQLRGRVGRGAFASSCYLLTGTQMNDRLEVLETNQDGFQIAEADLDLRGPGEFIGTRQAGELPFRMANLIRDKRWLNFAREDAIEMIKTDPGLDQKKNEAFLGYFKREGMRQLERFGTS